MNMFNSIWYKSWLKRAFYAVWMIVNKCEAPKGFDYVVRLCMWTRAHLGKQLAPENVQFYLAPHTPGQMKCR